MDILELLRATKTLDNHFLSPTHPDGDEEEDGGRAALPLHAHVLQSAVVKVGHSPRPGEGEEGGRRCQGVWCVENIGEFTVCLVAAHLWESNEHQATFCGSLVNRKVRGESARERKKGEEEEKRSRMERRLLQTFMGGQVFSLTHTSSTNVRSIRV